MGKSIMCLSGCRGNLGETIRAYMVKHHPEVTVDCLYPFPFSLEKLSQYLKDVKPRYFVNTAGMAKATDGDLRPFECMDVNSFGVLKQLEMIRVNSPETRYINLGSIYEDQATSVYASSKRIAREMIKAYRETYGLYAVQATLGFTEHVNRDASYLSKRITLAAAQIAAAVKSGLAFEPLKLKDIDQRYQWTWAEDVADGIWRMLNQETYGFNGRFGMTRHESLSRAIGEYAIVDPTPHTVREFIEVAFKAAGIRGRWYLSGNGEGYGTNAVWEMNGFNGSGVWKHLVDATAGGTSDPVVDSSPIQRDLGWAPATSFTQLVTNQVKHDLKQ